MFVVSCSKFFDKSRNTCENVDTNLHPDWDFTKPITLRLRQPPSYCMTSRAQRKQAETERYIFIFGIRLTRINKRKWCCICALWLNANKSFTHATLAVVTYCWAWISGLPTVVLYFCSCCGSVYFLSQTLSRLLQHLFKNSIRSSENTPESSRVECSRVFFFSQTSKAKSVYKRNLISKLKTSFFIVTHMAGVATHLHFCSTQTLQCQPFTIIHHFIILLVLTLYCI